MARRHKRRRGIVLLIILTLLTLLIVVGLTFALLSGQFRRGADASARQQRYGMPKDKLLDRAMYPLLRDTYPDTRLAITGHSLLGDLYGHESVVGTITGQVDSGQFVQLTIDPPLVRTPGFYNGCVLTIGSSTIPGEISVRVVRHESSTSLLVERPEGDMPVTVVPGSQFVLNDRPNNGTGAGYNASSDLLDPPDSLDPPHLPSLDETTALLPNYGAYVSVPEPKIGGMDESYDAVDYQNMFLAMVPPNRTLGIIPSFHRPELVNYWLKRFADEVLATNNVLDPVNQVRAFRFAHPYGLNMRPDISGDPSNDDPLDDTGNPIPQAILDQIVNLKRKIILRPLPEDHPDFVNRESFALNMGWPGQVVPINRQLNEMQWDVDNDGDGIADSIWVDVGMPVQTDPSGRRYRPMVGYLCCDLDGKLNVNAHSNPAHFFDDYASGGALQPVPQPSELSLPAPYAGNPNSVVFARGLGYGPADIFLGHIFLTPDDFRNILTQRYRHNILDNFWAAGKSNEDDFLSAIKCGGIPWYYADPDPGTYDYSSFGTPPDLLGRGATGLDYNGQPVRSFMGLSDEPRADPYELVLNQNAAGFYDAPFTVAELERLLRWHDVDAFSLPERLLLSRRPRSWLVPMRRADGRSSRPTAVTCLFPQALPQSNFATTLRRTASSTLSRQRLHAVGYLLRTSSQRC